MQSIKILGLILFFYFTTLSFAQNAVDQAAMLKAYEAAIYDASVYKFSNLRPLKPLKFDEITKTAEVVTFTNWTGYKVGKMTLTRDIWVTAEPEVKEVCKTFSENVELRLRQLLGLHPNNNYDRFVSIEVKQGDIFRPTANPDPATPFPCSCPITPKCGEEFPKNTEDTSYVRWMADQMLNSYIISESPIIPYGYPWTRLGYTYDWKPGANKYGASEYVIRKNSEINVTEATPVFTYCKKP
jgi:hypothetical protein